MRQCFPSPILLINISYLLLKKHSFLPDSFLNNQNLAYLCINSLKFCTVFIVCQVEGYENILKLTPDHLLYVLSFFRGCSYGCELARLGGLARLGEMIFIPRSYGIFHLSSTNKFITSLQKDCLIR